MAFESLKKLCNTAQFGKYFEGPLLIPSVVVATSSFIYLNQLVQKQVVQLAESRGIPLSNVTWDKVNETVVREWGSITGNFQNLIDAQPFHLLSSRMSLNPLHLALGSVLVLGVGLAAAHHFCLKKRP